MFRALRDWWTDPAREASALERDAKAVAEGPMATHDAQGIERLRESLLARLAELEELTVGSADPSASERLELRYRALNREARKRADMDEFTVLTLAMIALRAARLGARGEAASAHVRDAFTGGPVVGRPF